MKKIYIFIFAVALLFAMRFSVGAEQDVYGEIYRESGMENVTRSLDGDTRAFLDSENIDPGNSNWINSLKAENVFSHIFAFLKNGAKTPVKAGTSIMAIIIIAAAFNAYGTQKSDTAVRFAVTLSVCAVIVFGIYGSINAAVNAVRGSSAFMLSFVPVYMSVLSVAGAGATAVSGGGLLLAAAEFISGVSAFFLTALMGAYLSLGISSSVSPLLGGAALAETLKKTGMWMMSLFTTVFIGVLSVTSTVNSASDSMAARTAKFIIGTCVPVAGTALSGAVNTVSAGVSVLKTSVGIYGVVVLFVMLLPVLAELLAWRLMLCLSAGVCGIFSVDGASELLKAVDSMFAFLTGALLLVEATFIISLSVIIGAVRAF